MTRVLIPRESAEVHPVAKGETLGGIHAAKCTHDAITLEEFFGYNFGTAQDAAVNRALVERVGCSAVKAAAADSVLDPGLKPAQSAFQLRLPRVWKPTGLQPMRTHTVALRERLAPPGVSLTALDPWFLPRTETCRIGYALDGAARRADKAEVTVYASKYSSAAVDADGGVHYPGDADLADTAIWARSIEAVPRAAPYAVDDWRGESAATVGVLKKRGDARYVNVASSPYTVVVRYRKHEADAGARIVLEPFWPTFRAGKAVPASLVIRWSIKGCTRTLEHGQLLVVDKGFNVVLRKALDAADIARGTFAWTPAKDLLSEAEMPYRVQLQAHTGDDEENGVALAAMHTEVRLWVHPKTGQLPTKPLSDPQSMDLQVAPYLPAEDVPAPNSDRLFGLHLATLGYHPGPVDGDVAAGPFKMALSEFQRSYPKKARLLTHYQRQAVTGLLHNDSKEMLTHPMVKPRPCFGEAVGEDFAPADLAADAATARLGDKAHERGLIVWVDDHNPYTEGPIPAGCDPQIGLNDYRGGMDLANDGKVARDLTSICRPWVPLRVRPRLLSRADGLDRDTMPAWNDAMAGCVGPLRIDWSFGEVREDRALIARMMAKLGVTNAKRVRTATFVSHTLTTLFYKAGAEVYFNCPVKHGGLRPDAAGGLGTYYKDLFGLGAASLKPWKALDDGGAKRVVAPVHDDLGQADDRYFASCAGRSGVYFRPSTIAGDGYRVRAEVSFAKAPGDAAHPNHAALAARYPSGAVAQSCQLRVWRRTSVRGNVTWTAKENDWTRTLAESMLYYRACHVHFVHTSGVANSWSASNFVDTADARYKNAVAGSCVKAPYTDVSRLAPHADHVWPWVGRKHFGIEEVPDPGIAYADFRDKFLEVVFADTWSLFRGPLLTLLLDGLEKRTGRYRGHTLVSFSSSPAYKVQTYYCSAAAKHRNMLIEARPEGGSATGDRCHVTGCIGTLAPGFTNSYRCPTCNADYPDRVEVTAHSHPTCETQCAGMKQPSVPAIGQGPVTVTYACDVCHDAEVMPVQYYVQPPYACGRFCGGNDNPTSLTQTASTRELKDGLKAGLPLPAVGSSLGATYVFEGHEPMNWAHEMGHHRHMEHAAGAPGEKTAQHDSEVNPHLATLADAKDVEKRWDRACVMGYVDKQFFCGKCVLKNRGWKVENLGMPARDEDGL